ncbi:MAG: tRNA (adenosine(37)-N6)-threonylcarbamoyltransferase complex dimerization subunit type 1 TsaB [Thermoleophilaceae bacterium]
MNVLGFDTSTAATAVCVLRSDGEAFEHEPPVQRLFEPPGHARELMPAVDRLMRQAGLGFGDLDALAVGIGPGGFTGLRIGLATAHGIAHGSAIALHPVSSLAALAAGMETDTDRAARLPLIDARRGEVYGAVDGGSPFVASPEDAAARAHAGALAAGDGSIRFRETLEAAGIRVAPGDSRMHVVRGLYICRLAEAVQPAPPEAVVPCYLRAPDAKPPSRSGG